MVGKEKTYKVANKYIYAYEEEVVKIGDIFSKDETTNYDGISGIEFTIEDAGRLFLAVDNMFYDISNQWEDGFDIEEFVGDLRKIMYGD